MGAHSTPKTKSSSTSNTSSSSTGGFGWKFLALIAVASVVAWFVATR